MAQNDLRSTILTEHRKVSGTRHILAFINFIAVLLGTLVTLFLVGKRGAPDVIFVHLYILLAINVIQLVLCITDYVLKNHVGVYLKYLPIVSYGFAAAWVIVTISELIFGTLEIGVLRNDLLGVAIIQFVVSLVAYLLWPMMDRMAIDSMIKPSARQDETKRAKSANGYVLRYVLLCLFIVVAQVGSLLVYKVPPKLYDLFAESRALKYELSDTEDGYMVTKVYAGTSTLVNIPATYNRKPVIGIAKGALVEDDLVEEYKVTQIVFGTPALDENGDTVYETNLKYIEEGAIQNNNIEELSIPESVVKIGASSIKSTSLKEIRYAAKADFEISYLECESLQKIIMEGENVGNIVSLEGMSETTNIQISKDIYNHYREANLEYVGSFTPILAEDEYYIDFFTGCDYYVETIFGKLGETVSVGYQDLVNADLRDKVAIAVDTEAYINDKHELGTEGAKADSAFRGWYFDPNFTQECSFSLTIPQTFNKTTALYAKWITEYTGTLDWGTYKPNNAASEIHWTDEDVVDFPVVDDRLGYTEGVHWTVNSGKTPTSNSLNISENVTLHGTWTLDKPTIDIESVLDYGNLSQSYDRDTVTFTFDESSTLSLSADYQHPLDNSRYNGKQNNYSFAWRKVGVSQYGSNDSAVSLHNVVDQGEYVLEVTLQSPWGETSVESTGIKVNINRKDIQMGTVNLANQETTYNALKQKISYTGVLDSENIKETYKYYVEKDGGDVLVYTGKEGIRDAGTYKVEVLFEKDNEAEAANYNTATRRATFVIAPKQLTYVRWIGDGNGWTGNSVVYNGVERTYTMQVQGILSDDEVNIVYEGEKATNAGNYTVQVKGIDNPNYSLDSIAGEYQRRDWTIAQREVSVSEWRVNGMNWTGNSIVYDGNKHSVSALLEGKVNGETVNFVYSNEPAFSNEGVNADTYRSKIVGVDNDNYYFDVESGLSVYTWSITQRPLNISYPSVINYTYKSTAHTVTATISNVLAGELALFNELDMFDLSQSTPELKIAWGGSDADSNQFFINFNVTDAGNYTAAISGLNVAEGDFLKNYVVTEGTGVRDFEIAPRKLVIEKPNKTYTYTGLEQELPIVVSGIYATDLQYFDKMMFTTSAAIGRVNSDNNYELVYRGTDADTYDVSVSAFEYMNGNYVLSSEFVNTIVINKQTLRITAWQVEDLDPNGMEMQEIVEQGTLSYNYYGYEISPMVVEGLVNNETVDFILVGNQQKNAQPLSPYVTTATLDGDEYPNYVMAETSLRWFIDQKAVDFTWTIDGLLVESTTSKGEWADWRYYDGEVRTLAPKFQLLGDDTATVDATTATNTPLNVKDVKSSGYNYEITSISNSNYKLGEGLQFYFEILKKELTVVWVDPTTDFVYNGQYQSPTFVIEGIAQSDIDAGNLTVETRNGFNSNISFVADGGEYSYVTAEKGFAVDVGTYSIKEIEVYKNGSLDGNYELKFETDDEYSFTIAPKSLDLTGVWTYQNSSRGTGEYKNTTTLIYNTQEYVLTTSFDESQLVKRLDSEVVDEIALTYSTNTYINANEYETNVLGLVGTFEQNYTLNLTQDGETGYSENDEKATLTWEIHQKRLALTWDVTEKTYSSYDQYQWASVTYGAEADDDGLAYSSDYVQPYYTANYATNAGTYTAIVSRIDNSNYYLDESTTSQEWTIKPYAISLSWTQQYFTYNAQPQSPTASWYVHGKTVHAATYENTNNVNVGTYTVTASGTDDSNYVLEETEVTRSYEYYIEAKEISLQWAVNNATAQSSYTYDGNEYEVIPTAVGVCEGDTVNLTYEDNKFKNAGNYTARVTAIDNTNYVLYDSNNYKEIYVNPKVLTFSWTWDGDTIEKNFTYDSNYHTLVAAPVGVLEGDTVNIIYQDGSATSVVNVGGYTVQIKGFDNPNYTFDIFNSNDYIKSIIIEPQKVRIVWTGLEQFTYDGNEHLTSVKVYGADDDKLIYTNDSFGAYKNASSSAYSLTLSESMIKSYDSNNSNYTLVNPVAGSATRTVKVDPKVIALTWSGLENVYDGNSHYAVATATNLCGSDTLNIGYRANRLSSYGSIGTTTNYSNQAGEYNVYVNSLGNDNYTLTDAENTSVTLKIAQQQVKITWTEQKTFEYNKTFHDFGAKVVGMTDGMNVSFSYTGMIGSRMDVGTYNLTVGTITNTNYTLENYEGDISNTYYITPVVLDIAWTDTLEYEYDGNPKTIKWWATNAVGNDEVYVFSEHEVLSEKGKLVYGGGNQINATIVGLYRITITSVSNGTSANYALPEDASQLTRTFEIKPQKVTLNWNGTTGEKTYSAATTWSMSATATGLIQGRSISIATVLDIPVTEQRYQNVGTYSVTVTGLESSYADNYTLEGVENLTGTINIVPQTVSVSWGSLQTVYNGYAQTPTVSVIGANDSRAVTFNLLTGGKSLVNVGSYEVSVELTNANYTLGGVDTTVTYTINPQAVNITWGNALFTYNGAAQRPTVTVVGASDRLSVPFTITDAETNAGVYTAEITLTDDNYTLEGNGNYSVNYEIMKQNVTVAWGETEFVYNGEAQRPIVMVFGVNDGKTVDFTQSAGQTIPGEYESTITLNDSNYQFASETDAVKAFSIAKMEVSIVWDTPDGQRADGTPKTITATAVGMVNGEGFYLSVSLKDSEGKTLTGTQVTEAGTYTATVISTSGHTTLYSIEEATNKTITFTVLEAEKEPEEEPTV